jgi:hypothetical protein
MVMVLAAQIVHRLRRGLPQRWSQADIFGPELRQNTLLAIIAM